MATKQLNTRIRVRYDTLANWNSNNPDLLKGEIAVVEIPASTNAGVVISEPAYLIKVGTGESGTTTSYGGATGQPAINKTSFKALPYVTAQAGDVYSWAKQEKLRITQDSDIHADTKTYLQNLVAGEIHDTDTVYVLEFGTGENAGKIRFGSKDGKDNEATWTYVDSSTNNGWHSLGSTLSAANDSVTVSAVSQGVQTVGVQISDAANNALDLKTAAGEKGLYVPKASVTAYTGAAGTGEVDVLTGITTSDGHTFTQTITQVYTKEKINDLINPGMEFIGVLTPTNTNIATSDIPTTNVKKGNSYKLGANGTISDGNNGTITVKAGDLIIAIKDNPLAQIDNINWAIIPAGDDVEDTWRAIKVDGTQKLANNVSTALDLVGGTGITLSENSGAVTFTADVNTIATTQMTSGNGSGKTLQGQIDTLNADNTTSGSVAKAIKDTIDGLDATISAGTDAITINSETINRKKVFTTIGEVDGKLNLAASTTTLLGIEDIDMGDYLILDGGNASSFASPQSGS